MLHLKYHSFVVFVVLVSCLTTVLGCSDPETPDRPESDYNITGLTVYSTDNRKLYVNYNINNGRIDALVENDGISGNLFRVVFQYPDGISPTNVEPSVVKEIDFRQPVNFTLQFEGNRTRSYVFSMKEDLPDTSLYYPVSVNVLTAQGTQAGIPLSVAGSDYIGLTRNTPSSATYSLAFQFPDKVKPASITPDPAVARQFGSTVNFTVQYDETISKSYTVTIGNVNDQDYIPRVVKGVWVTNVASDVLLSSASIRECVELCHDLGINTIFMVTYNNGKTMFRSDVMKEYFGVEIDPVYGNRDPLTEMILAAKPYGIKVVAWLEYGFASVYGDMSGGPIISRYPEWASLDYTGRITEKNKFYWLDPFNPEVQTFIRRLMTEVVRKYPDIGGVQGDDRLPALPSNGGYNTSVVDRYKRETGRTPTLNHLETPWLQWRADKLTDFGTYIYKHIKTLGGQYMMSWSPSPYSWSLQNYLQDWPAWLKKGQVDHIHPQLYRYSFDAYKSVFDQNLALMTSVPDGNLVFSPGVLLGDGSGDGITPEILEQILNYNRNKGISGETFFYYERIRKNVGFQQVIRKFK
jgi:uncharacterized lipoprotein YddW (UPF0748 family)